MQLMHLLPLVALLAACESEPESNPYTTEELPTDAATGSLGPKVEVWSDPKASYTDEGSGELPNGNLWVITRRDGPSGVSFSKREIDCAAGTFKYLQEGDTLEGMTDNAPSEMGPLTAGSISTLVADYACGKHGRGGVAGR